MGGFVGVMVGINGDFYACVLDVCMLSLQQSFTYLHFFK